MLKRRLAQVKAEEAGGSPRCRSSRDELRIMNHALCILSGVGNYWKILNKRETCPGLDFNRTTEATSLRRGWSRVKAKE